MILLPAMGFFEGIVYYFKTIFELISDIFNDTIFLIESVTAAITSVPAYLSWLPASVLTLFSSGIVVIVIYKILGRD